MCPVFIADTIQDNFVPFTQITCLPTSIFEADHKRFLSSYRGIGSGSLNTLRWSCKNISCQIIKNPFCAWVWRILNSVVFLRFFNNCLSSMHGLRWSLFQLKNYYYYNINRAQHILNAVYYSHPLFLFVSTFLDAQHQYSKRYISIKRPAIYLYLLYTRTVETFATIFLSVTEGWKLQCFKGTPLSSDPY